MWILGSSPPLQIVLGDSHRADQSQNCNETGESRVRWTSGQMASCFAVLGRSASCLLMVSILLDD